MCGVRPFSRCTPAHTGSGAWPVRGKTHGAHDGTTWVGHRAAHAPQLVDRGGGWDNGKVYIGTMDASISRDGGVEFGWAKMIYCKISNGD